MMEHWQYMTQGPGDITFDAEREALEAVARLLGAQVRGTPALCAASCAQS